MIASTARVTTPCARAFVAAAGRAGPSIHPRRAAAPSPHRMGGAASKPGGSLRRAATSAGATPTDADREAAWATAQAAAPRISIAEEARSLVANASLGVLSTLAASGAPTGSVVQYASDPAGRLIMSLSSMSAHTRELDADGRCALTVLCPGFASMADARVTLNAVAARLPDEEAAAARDVYMAAHPDAFWTEFGDFGWWAVDPAADGAAARAVLGFGRAGSVPAAQWASTAPDPVAPFSGPVCGHMNDDHGDAIIAMVKAAGLPGTVVRAAMRRVDRLGWDGVAHVVGEEAAGGGRPARGGRPGAGPPTVAVPVRVTFPRPATDRKVLKEVLVEMTRSAAGGGGKEA